MNLTIPGFEIQETIYQSRKSVVYRAIDETEQSSVVIKVLNEAFPSAESLAGFKYEFEIMKNLTESDSNSNQPPCQHIVHAHNQILVKKFTTWKI